MFRNKSANVHQFSMVQSADVPRSAFLLSNTYKTTFDAGYLIPFYVDEMMPGDTFNLKATLFGRMVTPLFPLLDNLHLDTHFFAVPKRILWANFKKFMGEQATPASSTSYTYPQMVSPANGYAINSLQDYMGLPTVGQVTAGQTVTHSALFTRAYSAIWNDWFRDENTQDSVTVDVGDGPDTYSNYVLLRRGKRKDYFTSCLPWPQKGTAVTIPLGTSAPVYGNGKALGLTDGVTANGGLATTNVASTPLTMATGNYGQPYGTAVSGTSPNTLIGVGVVGSGAGANSGLYADLSSAAAYTINVLRTSFQMQKFLERDARGGTRYNELIWSHFKVVSSDARLQRPEYLGGGSTPIAISPIAQTSGTGASGTSTPAGTLTGMATMLAHGHGFTYSAEEHMVVIGLVSIRADLTYQQGMRRMWSKLTRYDEPWPVFSHLGEQAVLNKEIYCKGDATAADALTFGYQERYAEYRYTPSMVTGLFRSTASGTLDPWHAAEKFTSLPTLNSAFIQSTPPIDRIIAVSSQTGKQFYLDCLINNRAVRPLPAHGTPGLIDHF